jgi:hypothetical protein
MSLTSHTTLKPFETETSQKMQSSFLGLVPSCGIEIRFLAASVSCRELDGELRQDKNLGMSCIV